jgi:hypothetical protein
LNRPTGPGPATADPVNWCAMISNKVFNEEWK